MTHDFPQLLDAILQDYVLPWDGEHGVAHWARVYENGMRLADETGANREVVALFAVLHDSKRISEGSDREHGPRAAEFAQSLLGELVHLPRHEFRCLHRACAGHTRERTHDDITIQTCWDADRLDLGRVGILPNPRLLCTEVAKRLEVIEWADSRATTGVVPRFILTDWKVDLHQYVSDRGW